MTHGLDKPHRTWTDWPVPHNTPERRAMLDRRWRWVQIVVLVAFVVIVAGSQT